MEDTVRHPLDLVYATYRDKLPALVPYLPDVRSIEVLESERQGSRLLLKNKWIARTRIPQVVRRAVGLEEAAWLDYAEWDDEAFFVRWRFEIPSALNEYFTASGSSEFLEDPNGTRVVLTGSFTIDAGRHPAVPRILADSIQPKLERFVFVLIKPNLLAVNRGLERYLGERAVVR